MLILSSLYKHFLFSDSVTMAILNSSELLNVSASTFLMYKCNMTMSQDFIQIFKNFFVFEEILIANISLL